MIDELNGWADEILAKGGSDALQGGSKPPPGFTPIPGSKVGGWHKRAGRKWLYWYPEEFEQHAKAALDHANPYKLIRDKTRITTAALKKETDGRGKSALIDLAVAGQLHAEGKKAKDIKHDAPLSDAEGNPIEFNKPYRKNNGQPFGVRFNRAGNNIEVSIVNLKTGTLHYRDVNRATAQALASHLVPGRIEHATSAPKIDAHHGFGELIDQIHDQEGLHYYRHKPEFRTKKEKAAKKATDTPTTKIVMGVGLKTADGAEVEFGDMKLTATDAVRCSGLGFLGPEYTATVTEGWNSLTVEVTGPGIYSAMRKLDYTEGAIKNEVFKLEDGAPKGFATRMLVSQVEQARARGFKKIKTYAFCSPPSWVGCKVWPKLGYNAPIPDDVEHKLRYGSPHLPKEVRDADDIAELMGTEEGRAFWAENARSLDMEFDLNGKSYSALMGYLERKKSGAPKPKAKKLEKATPPAAPSAATPPAAPSAATPPAAPSAATPPANAFRGMSTTELLRQSLPPATDIGGRLDYLAALKTAIERRLNLGVGAARTEKLKQRFKQAFFAIFPSKSVVPGPFRPGGSFNRNSD